MQYQLKDKDLMKIVQTNEDRFFIGSIRNILFSVEIAVL